MPIDGDIDAELVRRLLRNQFPQWADRPLSPLESTGVDNLMFRLGDDLVVRLPRARASVESLSKEQAWLPRLAPHLPLATPSLMGAGRACAEFPWPWSVNAWIEGAPLGEAVVDDWTDFSSRLARFLAALQAMDPDDGPAPGFHNFGRGAALGVRERLTREAISQLGDQIDVRAAIEAWEADSSVPPWNDRPRWIHGDIHGQNVLIHQGRLHAIIDFGGLGVGDPACDMAVVWRLLPQEARAGFRKALQVDADTWRRGRAWALSISVREMVHYRGAAPTLEAIAQRAVAEVLRDHESG